MGLVAWVGGGRDGGGGVIVKYGGICLLADS